MLEHRCIELVVQARMVGFFVHELSAALRQRKVDLSLQSRRDGANEEVLEERGDEAHCLHQAGHRGTRVAPCCRQFVARLLLQQVPHGAACPAAGWA